MINTIKPPPIYMVISFGSGWIEHRFEPSRLFGAAHSGVIAREKRKSTQ